MLFVPDKEYAVASYRIKSNNAMYDDVYNAYVTIKRAAVNNDSIFFQKVKLLKSYQI